MSVPLTTPLKREIEIDGEPYTVTISADGVRLARKRFRAGRVLSWRAVLERGDPDGSAGSGGEEASADAPARRLAEP